MWKQFINIILIYLISIIPINAKEHIIVEFSIPKAGTHLLAKAIRLITKKQLFFAGRIVSETELINHMNQLGQKQFLVAHQTYSDTINQHLQINNCHLVLMFRDPRDQVISFVHFIRKYPELWTTLQDMPIDDLITYLIVNHNYADHGLSIYTTASDINGIDALYRTFMQWITKNPSALIIHFEDLIGPLGGGNQQLQYETLSIIATYLGYTLSEEDEKGIGDVIFGGTYSFREGKIGEWKNYFNDTHKQEFKRIAGQLLIDLGYENDLNW